MSYYYADADGRQGPYTADELRGRRFPAGTLFWREGLPDWVTLDGLPELRQVVSVSEGPPPLRERLPPSRIDQRGSSRPALKYDPELDPDLAAPEGFSLERAFSFQGRIRRSEYGVTAIIVFVYHQVVPIFFTVLPESFAWLVGLLYVPSLWLFWAQGAKRCHDRGNSGWYQLIPFYFFVMLFGEGEPYDNRLGPDPKAHLRFRAR